MNKIEYYLMNNYNLNAEMKKKLLSIENKISKSILNVYQLKNLFFLTIKI